MSDLVERFRSQVQTALKYASDEKPKDEKFLPSVFELQVGHLSDIGEELSAELTRLRAVVEALKAERDEARHEFKNFHRNLCERFDYCHDEKDWRRDQVSLIEHIARRLTTPPASPEEDIVAAREERGWLVEMGDPPQYAMLSGDWDDLWTSDSSKALRFARLEDANAYIDHHGWNVPKAVEHMWVLAPAIRTERARAGGAT